MTLDEASLSTGQSTHPFLQIHPCKNGKKPTLELPNESKSLGKPRHRRIFPLQPMIRGKIRHLFHLPSFHTWHPWHLPTTNPQQFLKKSLSFHTPTYFPKLAVDLCGGHCLQVLFPRKKKKAKKRGKEKKTHHPSLPGEIYIEREREREREKTKVVQQGNSKKKVDWDTVFSVAACSPPLTPFLTH